MKKREGKLPEIGEIVDGRYEILRIIGVGGMGMVCEAWDPVLERFVALKFLHPEYISNRKVLLRFQQEARAISGISHRNICHVYDMVVIEGSAPYIAMELLVGEPLSDLLKGCERLETGPAVKILLQVLSALKEAHTAGITHRDVKPENIFLTATSDGDAEPKLVDFGISRYINEAERLHLTETGIVLGTPYYMSPEQARGMKDIDHRTDFWSAGVVLYEVLTGSLPFDGENYNEVMASIVKGNFTLPRTVNPEIPSKLEEVILKALAHDPDDRFATAAEFVAALKEAVGMTKDEDSARTEVVEEVEEGDPESNTDRERREASIVFSTLAVGIGIFLLLFLGSFLYYGGESSSRQRTLAIAPSASAPLISDGGVDASEGDCDWEEGGDTTDVEVMGVPSITTIADGGAVEKVPPSKTRRHRRVREEVLPVAADGGVIEILLLPPPSQPPADGGGLIIPLLDPPTPPLDIPLLPPPSPQRDGGG